MDKKSVPWADLLAQIVAEPGRISQAYTAFHTYSIGNQMLAYSQCAARGLDVAPIASFKRWQELGRQVKRGEKALALYMPVTVKRAGVDGEPDGAFQVFVLRNNWFTVDQTEGQDYVAAPANPIWSARLALKALDISLVKFRHADGNCQGYASGKTIAINPVAEWPHKTRFHELAHVVLGHTLEHVMSDSERTPRDIREVEAESVAYILCSVLDLPGLEESRGYVQHWLRGAPILDKSAMKIFGAANKILKAGQVLPAGGHDHGTGNSVEGRTWRRRHGAGDQGDDPIHSGGADGHPDRISAGRGGRLLCRTAEGVGRQDCHRATDLRPRRDGPGVGGAPALLQRGVRLAHHRN